MVSYATGPGEIKGLLRLMSTSSEAKVLAAKGAEFLFANEAKKDLPRVVSAIVDKRTGKVYFGRSGGIKNGDEVADKLKSLFPKESMEKWKVENCAECDALNKALQDKAQIGDLEMHSVKLDKGTLTFSDVERCNNCKVTTQDIKTTSDKK